MERGMNVNGKKYEGKLGHGYSPLLYEIQFSD